MKKVYLQHSRAEHHGLGWRTYANEVGIDICGPLGTSAGQNNPGMRIY